ncbi:hypothetical protein FEM80_16750 [Salmonella enterica]|uniref:Uncharacterized protein n=24 Tax=Salmonella enterica TaxID=28901 RepID=A0A5U7QMS2_SALER|nr:hypothetical protein [Salmonella enterica]EBG9338798.1 hypothetical protein [Salmonella enterica]EBR4978775.1 hypothetical protein [Salmonella enterica]ECB3956392.1 hypothetical protein [Salmonella enterica subsp. enterica serovar Saintpaul]ECP4273393.1 hypothetical protein [Salmonella enterica]
MRQMLYAVTQIKIGACFRTRSDVRIELKAVCVCNARRGKKFCAITKKGGSVTGFALVIEGFL